MSVLNCESRCRLSCTSAGLIAGVIIGVIAAFLQITGVITITAAFLWVLFGIAIVYLGVLLLAVALSRGTTSSLCRCTALNGLLAGLLAGLLGTIFFAVVLLAVGIAATSVISAILVALLLFFATLALGSTACYIRCLSECSE